MPSEGLTYTVLKVTEKHQVMLFARQVQRLGADSEVALAAFARAAEAGVFRAWWNGATLTTERLAGSRLQGEFPVRWRVSPYAHLTEPFAKPAPPSLYDSVREPGIITLLTDVDEREILEADVAAVVAWDGQHLVLPPHHSPRVDSLALATVAANFQHRRSQLWVSEPWPLLLLNAVAGAYPINLEGRAAFPAELRASLDEALHRH